MSSRECVTHHHACDCREAKFRAIAAQNAEAAQAVLEFNDAIKYVQNLHSYTVRQRLDCPEEKADYWRGAEEYLHKVIKFFGEG